MALTVDQARERAAILTPKHLDLVLDLGDEEFVSSATWQFDAVPGSSSFIEISPIELLSATLNGRPLGRDSLDGRRLPLTELAQHNELVVRARMTYSHDGEGLHRHVEKVDGSWCLYAMSFLDAAPRWFACFDQPDLKFTVTLTVHTPDPSWIVRGNGPAVRVDERQWRLEQHVPLASYLVTVVAGPFAVVTDEHDGIGLELLARPSLAAELERHAADLFSTTKLSFDAFHALFGVRYPFGDYVQAFVPDFNAGAMENPGCVTFREQLLFRGAASADQLTSRASTVAHELAHQWFGDLVTMTWWDDLWLNESFAEYLAKRVIGEHTDHPVWTSFSARKAWGEEADQAPSTHPVAGNGAPDTQAALANFDGISYAKGAALLTQLATRLGDDVFLAGLRDHIGRHARGNATAADLFDAWTRAGAVDLDAWVEVWLKTSGLDLVQTRREGGQLLLERIAPAGGPPWRPHAVQVAALAADGTELGRVDALVEDAPVPLALPQEAAQASAWVPDAGDQTWARLRFADGWRLPPLAGIADPITRAVVLNAVRDGIRHADLDTATALDLVLPAVLEERDSALLPQLTGFATRLVGALSSPEHRTPRRQRLAAAAGHLLERAEPASDRQLVALRTVLASTDDTDLLESWSQGRRVPPGISFDQDLRWLTVRRLQVLGAAAELVDRELARDQTTAGHLAAQTARVARPDRAAKLAALTTLTSDPDASNSVLYAIAEGLFLPEHHQITDDLVEPWLQGIVASSAFRGGWTLQRVIVGSVPWPHASREVVNLFDQTLDEELPAPVHRELTDARAQLSRLVRLRERDAATADG